MKGIIPTDLRVEVRVLQYEEHRSPSPTVKHCVHYVLALMGRLKLRGCWTGLIDRCSEQEVMKAGK